MRQQTHLTSGQMRFFDTMDGGEQMFNHQIMEKSVTKPCQSPEKMNSFNLGEKQKNILPNYCNPFKSGIK